MWPFRESNRELASAELFPEHVEAECRSMSMKAGLRLLVIALTLACFGRHLFSRGGCRGGSKR
jgi:hypothetical protein